MNNYAFEQCRFFLEQKINEQPENNELIKAYITLMEQKTTFDIAYFSQDAEIQKNWNDNQTEMNKAWNNSQTEIAKVNLTNGR